MFCFKWLKGSGNRSQTDQNRSAWPSPWILPVHVVSSRQDKDRHPVTKIAKCTIDTGNMQGNIVSRDFVENVLGFTSTSFLKMTEEEERGGTTISGALHIPQGVIHLTWYHKSSTRVFRDMRFLISPARNCDMIIGAQSIEEGKILSVPCLAANGKTDEIAVRGEQTKLELIFSILEDALEEKDGDPITEKLTEERKVVEAALDLREIVYNRPAAGNASKETLWTYIKDHYSEVSYGLDDKLSPILVKLRLALKNPDEKTDAKDPWIGPGRRWESGVPYEAVSDVKKSY